MEALLSNDDVWEYDTGEEVKPESNDNPASIAAVRRWEKNDRKARSNIILGISESELKEVKNCRTSHTMREKLSTRYESKAPQRKATLMRKLISSKLEEGGDVRDHVNNLMDTVDKLEATGIEINQELITFIILLSLPSNYDIFKCSMETREILPTPEILTAKILEMEEDKTCGSQNTIQNAMFIKKPFEKKNKQNGKQNDNQYKKKESFPFIPYKCHRCHKVGHWSKICPERKENSPSASTAEIVCMNAEIEENTQEQACKGSLETGEDEWCLDSGCTAHLIKKTENFRDLEITNGGKLNLASNVSTKIIGKGTAVK